MLERIIIYHLKGFNEWGTVYWVEPQGNTANALTLATDLANAEAPLYHNLVTLNRFEWIGSDGKEAGAGPLLVNGTAGGAPLPLRWGALIEFVASGDPGRPSVKYINGLTASWVDGEDAGALFQTAISNYSLALVGKGVITSNGTRVTGAYFKRWSDRRRIGTII